MKIEAVLTGLPSTLDAYLTTQVGPGTNASHYVALGQVIAPGPRGHIGYPTGYTTVFDGLSLLPGTYFLTMTSETQTGNWYDRVFAIITEAPGANHAGSWENFVDLGLDPLNNINLTPYNLPGGFLYRVTGEEASIPEPSSWLLLAAGLGFLGALRRR